MEPEVHIIEKYFQLVEGCLTMANIRCNARKEIDLLAMNPKTQKRFHVEVSVKTSHGFALDEKDIYSVKSKAPKIDIDDIAKKKFDHSAVLEKITEIFGNVQYQKILSVWDVKDWSVYESARGYGIEIMPFDNILSGLMDKITSEKKYGSRDEVIRTLELICLVNKGEGSFPRLQKRKTREIKNALKRKYPPTV